MNHLPARGPSRKLPALLAVGLLALASPPLAADDPTDAPKGAAVTVLKAAKSCFSDIVEVSGIVIAREETAVRPERQGLKVSEVLADAGETVTAGQTLARLTLPEGGVTMVQAPVAGLISSSSAAIGAVASGRGEALFSIIARSEFDLVGLVPTADLSKLQVNQGARIKVVGAGEVAGKVRRGGAAGPPHHPPRPAFLRGGHDPPPLVQSPPRPRDTHRPSLRLPLARPRLPPGHP